MIVNIIGAGPAGAYTAYLLAASGHNARLFDHKMPWEKPCGGGITFKGVEEFPILQSLKKNLIYHWRFISHDNEMVDVHCDNAMIIASRAEFGSFLIEEAKKAGAKFLHERLIHYDQSENITATDRGCYQADFTIAADGSNSLFRRLIGIPFPKEQRSVGIEYFAEGVPLETAIIKFYKNLSGYLWVFPRLEAASIGICFRYRTTELQAAEGKLVEFIQQYYPHVRLNQIEKSTWTIPIVDNWAKNQYHSARWALIGDAAGFCDPITGEGIYYAMKSAKLLSKALNSGDSQNYPKYCVAQLIPELQKSAQTYHYFYGNNIGNKMVKLALRSNAIANVLVDLLIGKQSYRTLQKRLKRNIPKVASQFLLYYLKSPIRIFSRRPLSVQQ